ncbi:MAG: HAMP domain-containing sensor histidine kinase [Bacteroidota bacterium]
MQLKPNRTYLFIAASSIALVIVLVIQVNWIVQTAKIKEELFSEKANMVLSRTTEAIGTDEETCGKIAGYVDQNSSSPSTAKLGKHEIRKIDSLFNYYMRFYNFYIDYRFEVIKPKSPVNKIRNSFSNYAYYKPLETSGIKRFELKLIFPDKKQFILAEMGLLFMTSVLLILIVLVLFWRTVLSLLKEKEISEHTTDFLNNMTHEFKTPLTNIALAGKMITKESTLQQDDKIKHYSSIILEENDKLRLQVEQVLSMTALERGEIPLQKTELDMHAIIHDSIKCMNMQMELKQGTVNLNLNADTFIIHGDKTHLTNAFCNLIDNALKYTKDKPELNIQTSSANGYFNIVIADNGIGIDKEHQQKVFDKFFRVPTGDVHDVKGFGLGLAYVKKIVELHRGTIELKSEKGTGTQFMISVPND